MTLVQLKDFITNGTVPTDFIIFVAKDDKFLVNQYIEAICKYAEGGEHKISSIYEPQQSSVSLLTTPINAINVLRTDIFEERAEDYTQFENIVVVCEQISKNIAKDVEKFTIVMPKLEAWQICDYARTLCPALDETEIQQLVQASGVNIEKVINEIAKISLFKNEEQKQILSSILFEQQTDLYTIDLFTIVNAFVDGDLLPLFNFLKYKNYEIFEPVVLANRTLSSLKNILLVTQNPTATAAELGVSPAQQRMLKYKYQNINLDALRQKIKFLTAIDLNLKSSKLELSKQNLFNYLVANLAYKIKY